MIRIFFVSLSCLCAMMRAALAHEFWLSAQEYQLPKGGQIVAELRVGQNFKGSGYAYLPRNTAVFFLMMPTGKTAITPRLGDRPAVSLAAPEQGLAVIVHETTDRRVYYQKADKFLSFVKNKGLGSVLAREKALTMPDTTFSESYRRYAKSLIAIGPGQGADQLTGLETEFVALGNPYTDDITDGLPLQLLYQGKPRSNVQIEVFEKTPSDRVRVFNLQTDTLGQVQVPVRAGHRYLVNSVVLRPTGETDPTAGPIWHSLWASLTFAVPD